MTGGRLAPEKVPPSLRDLIMLAEKWGVSDDVDRETAIESAPTEDLRHLVAAVQAVDEQTLSAWMTGDESYGASPSDEYLAFACLTMAFDSARIELERRGAAG